MESSDDEKNGWGNGRKEMLLERLEDQIAVGEIEDKRLDHLEHITWRQFETCESM